MVSRPEMGRVIAEFQATSETKEADNKHHEQTKHIQVARCAFTHTSHGGDGQPIL